MSAVVEELETGESQPTPLLLIHDGGGTIFQYFTLGPYGRQTYAIANPYFHDKTRPAGGVPQLAKEYVEAIRSALRKGSFVVGGWSFGGVISLEIARLLSNDADLKVAGLLLIDTSCPWRASTEVPVRPMPTFLATTSNEMKEKVLASFSNAKDMVAEWKQPEFSKLPQAVLLRAAGAEVAQASDTSGPKASDNILGWSAFPTLDIAGVIDVPGDHFSMFDEDRLDNLTQTIQQACTFFK